MEKIIILNSSKPNRMSNEEVWSITNEVKNNYDYKNTKEKLDRSTEQGRRSTTTILGN